jgi:hypothetical protein
LINLTLDLRNASTQDRASFDKVARNDVFNYVVLQMYPLAIKPTRSRRGSNFRQKPHGAKTHQSRVHARRNIQGRGVSALRSAFRSRRLG